MPARARLALMVTATLVLLGALGAVLLVRPAAEPATGPTGFVGALLAQGLAPAHALQAAVWLHGAAADACVAQGIGPKGLTASEIALAVRGVLNGGSK